MAEFHPLFPPGDEDDEESDPPDIQEVAIQRKEQGKYVTAPRTFLIGELADANQLYTEFGGGEYQLIGRDSRHVIRRRTLLTLPGPPKPMFDVPDSPPPAPKPQTVNPMAAMMGGEGGGIMGLIMMMMQQMMQSSAAAQAQQTQMFMAMMSNSTQQSAAEKQAQQEAYNRQRDQDRQHSEMMMAMMTKLSEARQAGNSSGGEEAFFKGVEFMRHFSTQQIEAMKATAKGGGDFDLEGLLGTALEALQGFNAFREMSNGGVPVGAASEVVQ